MSGHDNQATESCGDSVRSIVANITGILTFAYAVAAGLYFYISLANNSVDRLFQLSKSLEISFAEAGTLARSFRTKREDWGDSEALPLEKELDDAIERFYRQSQHIAVYSLKHVDSKLENECYK